MDNRDKLRRSNLVLILIVVMFLLFGVIYRIETGDQTLYLFGYEIRMPFTSSQVEETPKEASPADAAVNEASSEVTAVTDSAAS